MVQQFNTDGDSLDLYYNTVNTESSKCSFNGPKFKMTRINLRGLLVSTSDSVIILPIAEISCSQNSFSVFGTKYSLPASPATNTHIFTVQWWRTALSKLMCLNVFLSQSKKTFPTKSILPSISKTAHSLQGCEGLSLCQHTMGERWGIPWIVPPTPYFINVVILYLDGPILILNFLLKRYGKYSFVVQILLSLS